MGSPTVTYALLPGNTGGSVGEARYVSLRPCTQGIFKALNLRSPALFYRQIGIGLWVHIVTPRYAHLRGLFQDPSPTVTCALLPAKRCKDMGIPKRGLFGNLRPPTPR